MIPFQSFGNTLRWKFEKISTFKENEEKFSDVFLIGPTEWKIAVCNTGHFSIYLHYDSENKNDKTWLCETETTFKLLRQNGTDKNVEKTKLDAFHASQVFSGYPEFEEWRNVKYHGFTKNDSIIVEINLNLIYHDFSKKIENITDIIVNVENTEFHLTKGVLCSKSKYFNDLFITQKSTENIIKLDNLTAKDFCYILIPFNLNFNTIHEDTYENFMKLANDFGVRSIQQSCEYLIINNSNNKWDTIQKIKIAEDNGFELLMKKCIESLESGGDIRQLLNQSIFPELKETTRWRVMMRLLDFV